MHDLTIVEDELGEMHLVDGSRDRQVLEMILKQLLGLLTAMVLALNTIMMWM